MPERSPDWGSGKVVATIRSSSKAMRVLFQSAAPALTIIGDISVNDPSLTIAAMPKGAKPVATSSARKERAAWWQP
jgi:hypothetical protein